MVCRRQKKFVESSHVSWQTVKKVSIFAKWFTSEDDKPQKKFTKSFDSYEKKFTLIQFFFTILMNKFTSGLPEVNHCKPM
jgi:hypothetical protein